MKRNFCLTLLVLFILSACRPHPAGQGQAATATQEVTKISEPIAIPILLPTRPDFSAGEGGEYTQEQKSSIERGDFKRMEEILANWWQYWGNAENRPFHPETKPTFTYFWDKDGKSGSVLLQPGGEYGSRSFYMPIWNGIYLYAHPKPGSESYNIPVGMGPLELSGGDYVLTWMQGDWARVNENGEIMEKIDMETARWKRERFGELLPETLEEVRKNNVLRWDHLSEDLVALLEKEKEVVIDPNNVESFTFGIPNIDIEQYKMPSVLIITTMSEKTADIVSCSVIQIPNGEEFLVYGIAVKRPGSDKIGILHFAFSQKALDEFSKQINYKPELTTEETYIKLKSGDYNEMYMHLILWRGHAEEGGIWDPLLSLIPESSDRANEISFKLSLLLGDQTIDPKTGDWVSIQEYGEERLLSELGQEILPTVSIGVIY